MADKVILEAEVKSNIGEVSKDAEGLAGELRIMGVSLNDVKQGFSSMAGVAKKSFATIKAGMISTGIGALLVAFGSLVAFFTKTEKGGEKLRVIMAGLGATFSVLIDRVSTVGESISNIFNQRLLTTITQIANAFKGIGTEIKEDVSATVALEERLNKLQDAERELNVLTASRRARIEELKLVAEDVTKSEVKRLVAAQTAFRLEEDILESRVKNAEEARDIQKELNTISKSGEADLDALAEKEINLSNIKAESATKQIELNNKINAIEASAQMQRDAFEAKQIEQADAFEARLQAHFNARMALNSALGQSFGNLGALMEEGSNAAKLLALATIATNTAVGFMQGLNIAQKASIASGPAAALAFPIFYASQVAAILGAIGSAKQALSSAPGGGGGVSVSASAAQAPAPEMMSGAFTLSGGVKPEPVRAYVVTDEMTNSQNQLANIRRRATI